MSRANQGRTPKGEVARGRGGDVHQRPEVKPLIEKSGAERLLQTPPGTMATGGGIAGGGSANPLDHDTPLKPDTPASATPACSERPA
jgi:hypothetical protein